MSNQFCIRVGNNIKKHRKSQKMTLKELAEKVGLTEATVQKYEAGNIRKIDVEMLMKLSDALQTKPENLTEWGNKQDYAEHNESKSGEEEAELIKVYSQLTRGHKRAVRILAKNLLECQEKYNVRK